ncbi:hypothetical protein LINGRAHAP2_LOCUS18718 [Linum grandiflorum]
METKEQPSDQHESEEEYGRRRPAVSPFGVYFHSESIQMSILVFLEMEDPIHISHSDVVSLLDAVLVPLHPRFSSVINDQSATRLTHNL